MEEIEQFLHQRRQKNLLRSLKPANSRRGGFIYFKSRKLVDFSSNDYLGLSSHPKLKRASKEALEEFGMSASASRLLSGNLDIHHQLEEKTARFKGKEAALVFNSGYQANLGIISAVCKRGDAIFSDKLSHASIIDGILLSQARIFRFFHNDPNHLEFLLKKERHKFKNSLIITETLFSMDGDRAPLAELIKLKDKYRCKIMVDEAHATGIFGKKGTGLVEEENLADRVDLIMGTFSKALGSFGAYLVCSKNMKEYLINTSRSFIYSTALPPAIIAANLVSLDLIKTEPFRRRQLLQTADYFRKQLQENKFTARGSSQIVPLVLGDTQKVIALSQKFQDRGYWVLPIRPPTVPQGQARLRFSLTYHHTQDILKRLINDLHEISHTQPG